MDVCLTPAREKLWLGFLSCDFDCCRDFGISGRALDFRQAMKIKISRSQPDKSNEPTLVLPLIFFQPICVVGFEWKTIPNGSLPSHFEHENDPYLITRSVDLYQLGAGTVARSGSIFYHKPDGLLFASGSLVWRSEDYATNRILQIWRSRCHDGFRGGFIAI